MEMSPEHYEELKVECRGMARYYGVDYRDVFTMTNAYTFMFKAVKIGDKGNCHGDSGKIELPLYDYLDDNHIETALKRIFPNAKPYPTSR